MLFSENKEHTWWECRDRLAVRATVTDPTRRRRKRGSRKGRALAVAARSCESCLWVCKHSLLQQKSRADG